MNKLNTKNLKQLLLRIGSETPDNLEATEKLTVKKVNDRHKIYLGGQELTESLWSIENLLDESLRGNKNNYQKHFKDEFAAIRIAVLLVTALEEGVLNV